MQTSLINNRNSVVRLIFPSIFREEVFKLLNLSVTQLVWMLMNLTVFYGGAAHDRNRNYCDPTNVEHRK